MVSGDWSTSCQLSSPPLLSVLFTAGAPNCMQGNVWVGWGLSSGSPAETGLSLKYGSEFNRPFDPPGSTYQLYLSPLPYARPY